MDYLLNVLFHHDVNLLVFKSYNSLENLGYSLKRGKMEPEYLLRNWHEPTSGLCMAKVPARDYKLILVKYNRRKTNEKLST